MALNRDEGGERMKMVAQIAADMTSVIDALERYNKVADIAVLDERKMAITATLDICANLCTRIDEPRAALFIQSLKHRFEAQPDRALGDLAETVRVRGKPNLKLVDPV
jgi:hypothetical protein